MTETQWSLLLIAVIVLMIVVQCNRAMADCYTPLTCLYGNDLGRSMEYERQQRQIEDMQRRQREMEMEQDYRNSQRELDRLRDQVDRWRTAPPRP